MKLASYRGAKGGARVGAVARSQVFDLDDEIAALALPEAVRRELERRALAPATSGMLRLLQAGGAALRMLAEVIAQRMAAGVAGVAVSEVELFAPVPRPGKVVAIGRNYADHAKETGVAPLQRPRIIAKLPSSVVGPNARIKRPATVCKLDFEVELAVIIGSFAHRVPRERALEVVAGYTVLDDLSAREFQFDVTPAQTTFAKSMDGFCPMGPWLATGDEIPDPQVLELDCKINGRPMQHGRSADMLFPVHRLIEYITSFMTLEPGDVIATGTPAGSGAFRNPPVWLAPGDRIRMEIPRIGVLEHEIIDPDPSATDTATKEQA